MAEEILMLTFKLETQTVSSYEALDILGNKANLLFYSSMVIFEILVIAEISLFSFTEEKLYPHLQTSSSWKPLILTADYISPLSVE